ncbi:hypothetical protein F4823DRAFT_620250 [Ustulina deusta]|nr:hypothetical protein F4823DRAFT_620250 [Ustulina deusta]
MMEFAQRLWSTLLLESNPEWRVWILTVMAGYVLFCTTLRNSQKHAIETKFTFKDRASLAKMTLKDARAIQTWLAEQQFPSIFSAAIFFALFKVLWTQILIWGCTRWALCPPADQPARRIMAGSLSYISVMA